ncbi:MAG: helix-turn-helix domain-containing protein [Anaerovoracaceae bacterium]
MLLLKKILFIFIFHIKKRRHVCPCCNKKFNEHIDFLPKYYRTTTRLWAYIITLLRETRSMSSIATACNVSSNTVARAVDYLGYGMSTLPKVLSVDEFKGNAGGEKFQCIITNTKKRTVLDILSTRKQDHLLIKEPK